MKKYSCLLCLWLLACASAPETADPSSSRASPAGRGAGTLAEASAFPDPLILVSDKKMETELNKDSPALYVNGHRSYFATASFRGKAGQSYKVEVWSLCNCLGFRKRTMHPVVAITKSNGEMMNQTPTVYEPSTYWSPSRPALNIFRSHVHAVYQGSLPADADYRVVVATDVSRVDARKSADTWADSISFPPAPVMEFDLPIKPDRTGTVVLQLNLN